MPFTPYLDLEISKCFYNCKGYFVNNTFTCLVYRYGPWPAILCSSISFILLVFSFCVGRWKKFRAAFLCLALALLIGSGVVIHGLKDVWGRPRPIQVVQFGGSEEFCPYYIPHFKHGEKLLKSFPCGHASAGFFFLSLWVVGIRERCRKVVISGIFLTLMLGISLSIGRIAQGKHFFSDTFMSFIIMFIVVKFLDWMIYDINKV